MEAGTAYHWAQEYLAEWTTRPHPRGPFYLDVTTSASQRPFPWWLLCIGELWGEHVERVGVDTWAVCWLERQQEPASHIVLKDDTRGTLRLSPKAIKLDHGDPDVSFR